MCFSKKLLEANNLITEGTVTVNGKKKSITYLARVSDIIQKKLVFVPAKTH